LSLFVIKILKSAVVCKSENQNSFLSFRPVPFILKPYDCSKDRKDEGQVSSVSVTWAPSKPREKSTLNVSVSAKEVHHSKARGGNASIARHKDHKRCMSVNFTGEKNSSKELFPMS